MGFASALPKIVIAADRLAKLPRRASGKRPFPRWDPTACNPFEQEDISKAFFSLGNSAIPEIRSRKGDWETLADQMTTKTVSSLTITCDCGAETDLVECDLKSMNFGSVDTSDRGLLDLWLIVEVVKLCGGTDLDAWAVKNWLFSVDKSSRPYLGFPVLASEKVLMCAGGTRLPSPYAHCLAGKFTCWDATAGKLWPSGKDAQGKRARHGTNLIDMGITYWQHPCP